MNTKVIDFGLRHKHTRICKTGYSELAIAMWYYANVNWYLSIDQIFSLYPSFKAYIYTIT